VAINFYWTSILDFLSVLSVKKTPSTATHINVSGVGKNVIIGINSIVTVMTVVEIVAQKIGQVFGIGD